MFVLRGESDNYGEKNEVSESAEEGPTYFSPGECETG